MPIKAELIVSEIQTGKLERFDELFLEYADKIYRFVYYRTHHRQTAEDLTSTIFMKAFEKISTFDESKGTFSVWLYRIARNLVVDHYRRQKDVLDLDEAVSLESQSSVEREVAGRLGIEKVKIYLDELPHEQREIVILRIWDGFSFAEIGELLDKTEGSCKMSFSRILTKLRAELPTVGILLMFLTALKL